MQYYEIYPLKISLKISAGIFSGPKKSWIFMESSERPAVLFHPNVNATRTSDFTLRQQN